ncbi:hypothetical protein [Flavobacterium sp. DG2-3]|uniref:hypothetical protein n=1 Tax=Flavobacterium sp. DG2-3 TaxID=3068317 RepID=UPI00273F2091|nr:hypothetical protein [Flavobacterium sp. DG2-3]MDP5201445.1 hypothetical protein [Flavobacterium sp. DG2-3]
MSIIPLKTKTSKLAPIEVEILLCRGSAQKIETDSGTRLLLKTKISASKNQLDNLEMCQLDNFTKSLKLQKE